MRKTSTIVLIAISYFLFFAPVTGLAQTTSASSTVQIPVSFHVEVGNPVCLNSVVTASVLFVAEPKKGGYFEITGGAIDRNEMTLDQRVALKTGTYKWEGVANEGYKEISPSSGEFTIPTCSALPPPASSIVPKNKMSPAKEVLPVSQKEEILDNPNTLETTTVAPASGGDKKEIQKTDSSRTSQVIIFCLIVLGALVLVFGLKSKGKKT